MDKIARGIAYILPDRVLYWVVIRVWARLTTTKFTERTPEEVTLWDALEGLRN